MLSRNIYNSPESSLGDSGKRGLETGYNISARPCTPFRIVTSSQIYKPYRKDHTNEAVPATSVNTDLDTDLDTDTSTAITVLLAELLSTTSTSAQAKVNPEVNDHVNLAVAVPLQTSHETLEMSLKRAKPALRLKRPRSTVTPLTLLTPPCTPTSPEEFQMQQIPQRVVSPINIAIMRYLANISVHAKDRRDSSDSKSSPPTLAKFNNSSDSEDVTPFQSPTSELNSRRSSASSMSSIGSTSTYESLSTLLLEQLAKAHTFLSYIQILFRLYHVYILPSIRHHYATLYTSWCIALDTCAANGVDSDTDFNVLTLEKEMELLVDWVIPGMGNAIELARKRWEEEERWVGVRDERRWETPSGARGEGRMFKHLADRFAGLHGEGSEVLIRMAREKLVGRGWETTF